MTKKSGIEFNRFGGTIPTAYWGCCAVDIIQVFNCNPDDKASIQLVNGDSGDPIIKDNEPLFSGPTNLDIFKQRLRVGTFSSGDLPNHAFLCVLTESQLYEGGHGKKWLKILKEHGFEFIRAVSNSVYAGSKLYNEESFFADEEDGDNQSVNYIFGLFRNIGKGRVTNPYLPPKEWMDIEGGVYEDGILAEQEQVALAWANEEFHLKVWNDIGKPKFLTEKELDEQGVPVTYAGMRSKFPQESREARKDKLGKESTSSPWQ